ncbi:MAG: glycosyltransferase family 4 protein [Sporolactobacillus sp.]|jgi:spore coat protein SA|nr:glycosyltransferase family 4 protein [Sporolactobacillus sp.]
MNIAMIATEKLPVPPIRGGATQIYLQAAAERIARSDEITIFSIADPQLAKQETSRGVHHIRIDADQYPEQLETELKKSHYDVVHLCNRPAWLSRLKAASPESRFVLSVHNDMFSEHKIDREAGKQAIDAASRIVTVSDFIRDGIVRRFPEAGTKTETVYSGVDPDAFYPPWTDTGADVRRIMRRKAGCEAKKVILFVGRLSKVKGPHILLQALPTIIARHPEAMLVFIGSKWFGDNAVNNYVRHLFTLAATQREHVTFIQFVKPVDMPYYYAMADLFVCSSQWQEPLARVHYEAMAAGLPIVTTNRGGNKEAVDAEKNGVIIERFDEPSAYAKVIGDLLDDENRRQAMGRHGRKKAEERYSWERVAGDLLRVYRSVST